MLNVCCISHRTQSFINARQAVNQLSYIPCPTFFFLIYVMATTMPALPASEACSLDIPHTYIHTHRHIHAHTHMHSHTYMCVGDWAGTHVCVCVCAHTHTHTHTHTEERKQDGKLLRKNLRLNFASTHTFMHAQPHIFVHTQEPITILYSLPVRSHTPQFLYTIPFFSPEPPILNCLENY